MHVLSWRWSPRHHLPRNHTRKVRPSFQPRLEACEDRTLLSSGPPGSIPKSLVIGLDGLRPDALEVADAPYLHSLIDGTFGDGTFRGAYSPYALAQDITVSGPNHSSILTGVHRTKHGVRDNTFIGSRFNLYPDYFTRLEAANPALNTVRLMTWSGGHNAIPTGADARFLGSDASNAVRAAEIMAGTSPEYTENPDALYIFFDDTDAVGHTAGFSPYSARYLAEIAEADSQIGLILTAMLKRPDFATEDWQIIVVSDHGGAPTGIHAGGTPEKRTIPFLVSGRSASQGELPTTPSVVDVAPTVLEHLGVKISEELDGRVQGKTVLPGADLASELAVYLRFEDNYEDSSGRGNHAQIGGGTPTLLAEDGKFGGGVSFDAAREYVTLGAPKDLNFGTDTSFTVAFWVRRTRPQPNDSAVIGNKNWLNGRNQGWVVAYDNRGGGFVDMQSNLGDGVNRSDVDPTDRQILQTWADEWDMVAVTFDRLGSMRVFTGGPSNGFLSRLSITGGQNPLSGIGNVDTPAGLATNIGQDGTGTYPHNLFADLDDLAIWRRVLTWEELNLLFNYGAGTELANLLPSSPGGAPGGGSGGMDAGALIAALAEERARRFPWVR